ncbi:glycosyltransferase family 2 protein [Viridibacillus sp. YIM B01967]|uniref:Glycosyltransferase family 2 protein n=1 Tax=Viridibacillus soli TaxID=2798301 RepID=A0ABS1HCH8_9BACL|nr:glycosyltransferase family 2 protein [Viridibacillus soli]MBK3497125.1 glycosyltransferase family 2 protein [Viridibacillus soli]
MENSLSIVITTYNRPKMLKRCLASILNQNYSNYEIIVVDDHSKPSYQDEIMMEYSNVKYFYQNRNEGPGAARNRGIKEAINKYVVIMDDDDIFVNESFIAINNFLLNNKDLKYPVFNFLSSNTIVKYKKYYHVYSFSEMISDFIIGDVIHLIRKDLFDGYYLFPTTKIGSESLLWYQIAIDFGFPIINNSIVQVMGDSPERLTNTNRQVEHANLFAEYQIDIITKFSKEILASNNEKFLVKKYVGAITYLLLSTQKKKALYYLGEILRISKKYIALITLFFIPNKVLIKLFNLYRKNNEKESV